MSKRIRLSISPEEKQETDWLKWFLCQVDKDEVLKYPQNPTESLKSGHKTLSNLKIYILLAR